MPASSRMLGDRDAGGAGAGDHDAGRLAASRPVSRSALSSAASATTAVPCWSSWKTGMSSRSLSRVLDLEAARGGDVLEVDAAEARRQPDDGLDDLLDVGGVEADRDGVDAAELLEQHRLALHHRHRGGRADVAEAEHRGAVGDDGDRVGHPGVVLGQRRVRGDGLADPGDAGRVGQGQLVGGRRGRRSRRISILPPTCRSKTGSPACGCECRLSRHVRQSSHVDRAGSTSHSGHGLWPEVTLASSAQASRTGHSRSRTTPTRSASSATGPRCRESTPSSGLSLSSHHPAARARTPLLRGPLHRDGAVGEPGDDQVARPRRRRRSAPAAGRPRAGSAASSGPAPRQSRAGAAVPPCVDGTSLPTPLHAE